MSMKAHGRPRVIAGAENITREHTIAELLAGSPQLIELIADADSSTLSGHAARAATTVADLQQEAQK